MRQLGVVLIIIYHSYFGADVFSQVEDSIEIINVKAKRINFEFSDSFYAHTINSYPDKHFSIIKGFVKRPDEFIQTYTTKLGKSIPEKEYILKYELDTVHIDTLISYYPLIESNPQMDSIDIELFKQYGLLPMYPKLDSSINLYRELKYSYILRLLDEPILYTSQLNRVMRLVYYQGSFPYIYSYHSIRIHWENDSTKIFYSEVSLEGINNYKTPIKQNAILNPREVKRLEKYIAKINFPKEGIDGMSSAGWLIEYKDSVDYYIFLRGDEQSTRKHKATLGSFLGLTYMLKYLGMKYFK